MGASVLIFANKTDVGDCMTNEEIREVIFLPSLQGREWEGDGIGQGVGFMLTLS